MLTPRKAGLALGLLVLLLGGVALSTDALARRGVVKPKQVLTSLKDRVAALVSRVTAIEEADCGCPGLLEPVCVNDRTYLNFCEAACVLAAQGVSEFEDMIQFGVPRGIEIHGGPCEASLPVCGDSVCSPGHICVEGQCLVNFCNGFGAGGLSPSACPCPRGFRCAAPPEACGSACGCGLDPETGDVLGCPQVCLPACVPEETTDRAQADSALGGADPGRGGKVESRRYNVPGLHVLQPGELDRAR